MTIEQNLLNAAKAGDQETILKILNDQSIDIDPNLVDIAGRTALMWAAHGGHTAIVNTLLADKRVDLNCNDQWNTALIGATRNGHINIVRALLADERVDPNHAGEGSITALVWAAYKGHSDIVRALLADERVDFNRADENGCTGLILAAVFGHINIVRALLADERVDPNRTNEDGNTALILAAENGHGDIVLTLLADERVNPNRANHERETALMWAARGGHAGIVNIFLADERVDPNHANERGNTALIEAARRGHSNIVCALLADERFDRSHADQAEEAIIAATKNENDKALRLLLEFSGQRLSDDEIANLADRDRDFYKRILTRRLCRARFRGIVRAMVMLRRIRLRTAQAIYAPGETGFDAAAERFSTAVASHQPSSTVKLTIAETDNTTAGTVQTTDEPGQPATKRQRT
ncbi:MAG: ankyrin repeat domain-containing protein [Pseudomonadota bacterium]|nr:ankyrin repeat domain-containing protein [Pseudomonadota bacterium]